MIAASFTSESGDNYLYLSYQGEPFDEFIKRIKESQGEEWEYLHLEDVKCHWNKGKEIFMKYYNKLK